MQDLFKEIGVTRAIIENDGHILAVLQNAKKNPGGGAREKEGKGEG
ncbi:MAG: hypothetical protein ACLFV2_04235 [Desulfurivibrionaceae bacterium]